MPARNIFLALFFSAPEMGRIIEGNMAPEDKNARKYSASPPAGGISAQIPRRLPSAESDRIIDKKCCERRSRLMDELCDYRIYK